MSGCKEFHEMMEAQREQLRSAVEENKWYLSEQAHHDVGFKAAEKHFIDSFLQKWAMRFREHYCKNICKADCDKKTKS
jgi:hypothetical protein